MVIMSLLALNTINEGGAVGIPARLIYSSTYVELYSIAKVLTANGVSKNPNSWETVSNI